MLSVLLLAAFAQAPSPPAAPPGVAEATTRIRSARREQTPPQPTGEPGSIQGRVHSIAGNPLKRAMVTLRRAESRGGWPQTAVTDANGVFAFTAVEPGRYHLAADRGGFVRQEYGQKKPNKPGVLITVGPRQEIRDLVFQLLPGAVITGRVLDEDGEAMANSGVSLLRVHYQNGRRRLLAGNVATTNDLGEYRLHGIAPGRYYLSASASMNWMGPGPGVMMALQRRGNAAEPPAELAYGSLYYPNAPDSARAVPIEVAAGTELRGIDFNLQPQRTVRIRGKLTGFDASANGGNRPVVMLASRDGTMDRPNRNHAEVDPVTGAFEIRGVIPGAYTLFSVMPRANRQQTARIPLEVGSSNIENINLAFAPEIQLGGSVRFETPQAAVEQGRLRVILEPREGMQMMPPGNGPVQPDGSFTMNNLVPEEYIVDVIGLGADLYLKSAKAGNIEIAEGTLDLRGGAAPPSLDIVIGTNAGRVEGVVVNDKQEAAVAATAVLVPEGERRSMRRFYKNTTSEADGRFQLRGIAPGEYKLFAWEDIESGAYSDPSFLEKYESRGVSVKIREGSAESVSLKLLPAE